jgi:hypothetical protein
LSPGPSAGAARLRVEEQVHQAFQALGTTASPSLVVERMSELAHVPVVFEDLARQPLAVAGAGVPIGTLLSGWQE